MNEQMKEGAPEKPQPKTIIDYFRISRAEVKAMLYGFILGLIVGLILR